MKARFIKFGGEYYRFLAPLGYFFEKSSTKNDSSVAIWEAERLKI